MAPGPCRCSMWSEFWAQCAIWRPNAQFGGLATPGVIKRRPTEPRTGPFYTQYRTVAPSQPLPFPRFPFFDPMQRSFSPLLRPQSGHRTRRNTRGDGLRDGSQRSQTAMHMQRLIARVRRAYSRSPAPCLLPAVGCGDVASNAGAHAYAHALGASATVYTGGSCKLSVLSVRHGYGAATCIRRQLLPFRDVHRRLVRR